MALMTRIKVHPFLSFTQQEKVDLITSIQSLRTTSIIEAKSKKKKMTKTQKKIRKRKGKSVPNSKLKAKKALAQLAKTDPEAFLKTIAMFDNKKG